MRQQKIRIVKKNDEYSMEYEIGDIFFVDNTWYGGVNVTSKAGIPLSLDRDEYEECQDHVQSRTIDRYSYELGVMDCFCEMVAAGLKMLAMSHPCDTKEERDSYMDDVKKLCGRYGIQFYPEDEPLLTPLFPTEMNQDKYNYLFFRTGDVLDHYMHLKARQKVLMDHDGYTERESVEIAKEFGRILSYPEDGIERLLNKNRL